MDDLVYLISQTFVQDDIGQSIPQETVTPAWATIRSVTRAEFATGGQMGLQNQLLVITPVINYNGESIVQIGDGENAKQYGIYRTYFPPNSDDIELYLEKKAGV